MRNHRLILAGLMTVAMMLVLANGVAAVTQTIGAGDTYVKTYSAELGDIVSISWWTYGSQNLYFTVEDPAGDIVYEINATSGSYSPGFADAGDYVFSWENSGSGSVQLEYTVLGFEEFQDAWDTFMLILIIGFVAIIAIVVLIVVLLLMKGKKKKAQQAPAAPAGPPVIDGKCAKCGSPVDAGVAFCPKCGAPLR